MIKSKYILQSLHASIGDTKMLANASLNDTNVCDNLTNICMYVYI